MTARDIGWRALKSVAGIVAGYVALILLSTAVQEWLLGGVSYRHSGLPVLMAAGVLTPLAGAVAGWTTARVAGTRPLLHMLPMCLAVAVETTVLYRTGRVDGPLWFEALAGITLIAGIVTGGVLHRHRTVEG